MLARARTRTCVDAQHARVVDLDAHIAWSKAGEVGEDLTQARWVSA